MTALPRIRRHIDGRVALCFEPESDQDHWRIFEERPRYCFSGSIIGPLGDDWSELFVAELPEPDGWLAGDDGAIRFWDTRMVRLVVEDGEIDDVNWGREVDEIRVEALKMMAAVAACERFRAERDATT